jgi:hypothetical protein
MLPRIDVLVLSLVLHVWLAHASPLAAQARTGPSNRLPCTSRQAQDLLKELEMKTELDSVLELFRARQIDYSLDNLTKPFFRIPSWNVLVKRGPDIDCISRLHAVGPFS